MKPKLPDRLTIRKTKRISVPQRFVFVDTETTPVTFAGSMLKHVLSLGCAIYWQRAKGDRDEQVEKYYFESAADFWAWTTEKARSRETVYMFSHNVTFDFLALEGFRILPELGFTLNSLYYKFTTAVLRFGCDDRRLVIADSMNYFPVKLADLGRSVGLEKIETDFTTATREQLRERCERDTEIIHRAVRALVVNVAQKGLGSFRPTAAAMASSVYRHSFMRHEIVTSHYPKVVEFERSAYSGGYTGVLKLVEGGRPELYKLDVNGMYPSVMIDNNYPTRLVEFAGEVSIKMLERFLAHSLVIARVRLRANSPIYPYRAPQGLCYPLGEFTTTLTTPLLARALAQGEIEAVEQIAVYGKAKLFADYITHMTGQRARAQEAGDLATALFYKTMSNALYGKFGQQATRTKRVGDAPWNEFAVFDAFDPAKDEHWRELHAGGSVVFIYEDGESRYTSYAIAAHVTDYARLKLFDLARLAGRENVFYMDTDSLIVNALGRRRLAGVSDPEGLGLLKVEDSGPVFVGFSKKDYILGESRRMKGFDPAGRRLEGDVFQSMENVGFYGAARRDLRGGAFWHQVNKRYNPYLTSAHLETDGVVTPLRLPDDVAELGRAKHTLGHIRDLIAHTLTDGERRELGQLAGL